MREIIDEYAGILLGGTAAVVIAGMAAEFVLGGAGLHEMLLSFPGVFVKKELK